MQLAAKLGHVDGLQAVGLLLWLLQGRSTVVAVEVHRLVLRLDVVQVVAHLRVHTDSLLFMTTQNHKNVKLQISEKHPAVILEKNIT